MPDTLHARLPLRYVTNTDRDTETYVAGHPIGTTAAGARCALPHLALRCVGIWACRVDQLGAVKIALNSPEWASMVTLDRSGVTVLVVAPDVDPTDQRLTSTLGDLARHHDLVIVCGTGELDNGLLASYALTMQLRDLLPRRTVVAVLVSDHPDAARQEFDTIANLVDNSAVTVAIAHATDQIPVAVRLARHLQTRTLLRLDRTGCTPIGTDRPPTWRTDEQRKPS
jgi:hypothetical protein